MQLPNTPAAYIFICPPRAGSGAWLQLRNGIFDLLGQAAANDIENLRMLFEKQGFAKQWKRLKAGIHQLPQGTFVSIDYD
jgi:hypothetical protein